MKKLLLIFTISCAVYACKKTATATQTTSAGGTTVIGTAGPNEMKALVDGNAFISDQYGLSSFSFNGGLGYVYILSATTDISNSQKPRIQFTFQPSQLAVGTYSLGTVSGNINVIYSANSVNYYAKAGSINITSIDTAANKISDLIATFNFDTDTVMSTHHSITSGSVNY